MRPITILLGANASGKTSVLAPVLLLKQTDESRDATLSLKTKGRLFNAGSYKDLAVFSQDAGGPLLRVTILDDPADPRVPPTREAIGFWNRELRRLERRIHFDSATVRSDSVPDELLRAASSEAVFGRGPATSRLLAVLNDEWETS